MATNPFDAAARKVAGNTAGATLYSVQDEDADAIGRANAAARVLGLPPELVDPDLPALEQRIRMSQAREAFASDPKLAAWASNPRNAALAADDFQNLKRITDAKVKQYGTLSAPPPRAPTVGNFFSGVGTTFTESFRQLREGLRVGASDLLFGDSPETRRMQEQSFRVIEGSRGVVERERPAFQSRTMGGIYSGVASIAQVAPSIGIGILAGPGAGLTAIGAQVAPGTYGKYRARGGTPGEAALGSAGETAVEVATEVLPMGFLVSRFGKAGFASFVGGLLVREVPGEQIATFTQDAIDTAIANPDKTWADFIRERPDAQYETLVATVVQAGFFGGTAAVANRMGQAGAAEGNAAFLDDVAKIAQDSKVRQRDPSAFASFLEMQLDGSAAENIYVPAEKVRELFQDPTDMAEDAFWGQYAEQLDEAEAIGGDVVVKTSDFAAHVAGTPAWDALKDHVRVSPGGMSRSEAQEHAGAFEDAMRQTGERLAEQMAADRAAMEPRQKLAEQVRDKLMLAGFRPDVAMQYAELTAARYATRAQRLGQELTGQEADTLEIGADDLEAPDLSFEQSDMGGKRGKVAFKQGRTIITLFADRDLSTVIHESGHIFLEEMKADAELSEDIAADFAAVRAWFKSQGIKLPKDGSIPTEAHELWARGFERYAMGGKAPSSALRKAFAAFKRWLIGIYRTVDRLRAPITPEIMGVMERLIATDEEITAARQEQNIDALFATAADAGMTDAEFAAYRQTAEESRDEAHDALLMKVMGAVRREKTKAWKDEADGVRSEIAEQVDRQPVFRALQVLTTEKLDRQWLADNGIDTGQLPVRVPPVHAENGAHPDTIAEMSGFASGQEMVDVLIGMEAVRKQMREAGDKRSVRQAQIEAGVDAVMTERHGDILNDGTIEEEAHALIHNDKQGEVIATEIRSLARRTGKRPTPYAIARRWAAERIAGSQVAEATSGSALQRYERAARRAGKLAEEAMLKGDAEETYRQKQAQMLNNALISEAWKAKEQVDAAVRRLSKIAASRTRPSIDQDYLEQAQALLEQVELKPRSQTSIDRQQSFEEWAKAQQALGHDIVVPDSFGASLGTTHWSRLKVEQLLGLDETVTQIIHLGRLKQKLIDAKEERDYEEVIAEARAAIALLPPKPPVALADPSWTDRFKVGVAGFDASLLKIETLVDWLDSKNPNGVFNRIVFKPIADAQARESDMFNAHLQLLSDAMAAVPKEQLRKWGDRVTLTGLLDRDQGVPVTVTRQQMIAMALNMGNEGNAQRLADGYGWNEGAILQVLNRELTKEEWTYVQTVWDIIDGLWPEISEMERRVNGVSPPKVEKRPLETTAGTLQGGYYPAVYDSARDYNAEANQGKEGDLLEAKYTRATTRASATKERAEKVSRPILLDLTVIPRHVGEVIHDITHREAVMNADKFLSDKRIMQAIDQTLGREPRKQFRPWLKFIANQWAIEKAGNEGVVRFINKMRANATVVGLGFRFTTMMMQGAGYSNSFEAVGSKWVMPAVLQTLADMVGTFNFVMEHSGEMRHRMDTLDRDIGEEIRRRAGTGNPLNAAQRFAFHGIGYMDRVVSIPTWIGAYNKALASGSTEDQAVYAADKAIRQSQGSSGAKDMAAVVRGTGQGGLALKLMTMFYQYVSAVYQRQRTLGRDVRSAGAKDVPGLMARAWWLIVVPPLLSELMAGRGPDDDEDWAWWSFKAMFSQAVGAVPLARDLTRPIFGALEGKGFFNYQLSPLQRAGQAPVEVVKEVVKLSKGDDTKNLTKDVLETAGYWTGLVPGQVASSTQFLVDVGYGEQDPEGFWDWLEGLTKGKISEEAN